MAGFGRLAFAAVVITLGTCLSPQHRANAATVNVIGALDLNGQTFALASGETLNFDISGPIAGSILDGFVVFVGINGAPTVTTASIILNNAPFIGAEASANVNGSFAAASTNNCSNCGVTHPVEGNFFSITDSQRTLSVLSAINISQLNAANLPAGVSVDYTVEINLPNGLTATAATPLPAALPLFAGGLGALGLLGWRRRRRARSGLLARRSCPFEVAKMPFNWRVVEKRACAGVKGVSR